jgi:hypothetical protein
MGLQAAVGGSAVLAAFDDGVQIGEQSKGMQFISGTHGRVLGLDSAISDTAPTATFPGPHVGAHVAGEQ